MRSRVGLLVFLVFIFNLLAVLLASGEEPPTLEALETQYATAITSEDYSTAVTSCYYILELYPDSDRARNMHQDLSNFTYAIASGAISFTFDQFEAALPPLSVVESPKCMFLICSYYKYRALESAMVSDFELMDAYEANVRDTANRLLWMEPDDGDRNVALAFLTESLDDSGAKSATSNATLFESENIIPKETSTVVADRVSAFEYYRARAKQAATKGDLTTARTYAGRIKSLCLQTLSDYPNSPRQVRILRNYFMASTKFDEDEGLAAAVALKQAGQALPDSLGKWYALFWASEFAYCLKDSAQRQTCFQAMVDNRTTYGVDALLRNENAPVVLRAITEDLLATAQFYAGYYDTARTIYQHMQTTYPNVERAQDSACYGLMQLSVMENPANITFAIQHYEQFIAQYPDSPHLPYALMDLARRYHLLENYQQAYELYRRVAEEHPDSFEAKSAQTRCDWYLGQQFATDNR